MVTHARKRVELQHFDPAAVSLARLDEIDRVLDQVLPIKPLAAQHGFEHFFVAYAALASHDQTKRNVLLGREAWQRANDSGLLAIAAEHWPWLSFPEPGEIRSYDG